MVFFLLNILNRVWNFIQFHIYHEAADLQMQYQFAHKLLCFSLSLGRVVYSPFGDHQEPVVLVWAPYKDTSCSAPARAISGMSYWTENARQTQDPL